MTEKIFVGMGKEDLTLHHGYLICGELETVITDIFHFLERIKAVELRGSPDLAIERCDTMSVEDTRKVKEAAGRKAFGARQVIVLAFNSATSQAQNALLKVLEEPGENTHFFLVVPRLETVLATVRSRLFIIDSAPHASQAAALQVQEFLSASPSARLKLAQRIADDVSDGEREKQFCVDFVGHLEIELWRRRTRESVPLEIFDDLSLCRNYITDRSASLKMLLEHLALVLPPLKL